MSLKLYEGQSKVNHNQGSIRFYTLCIRDLEVKNAKSGSSLNQAIFVLRTKKILPQLKKYKKVLK